MEHDLIAFAATQHNPSASSKPPVPTGRPNPPPVPAVAHSAATRAPATGSVTGFLPRHPMPRFAGPRPSAGAQGTAGAAGTRAAAVGVLGSTSDDSSMPPPSPVRTWPSSPTTSSPLREIMAYVVLVACVRVAHGGLTFVRVCVCLVAVPVCRTRRPRPSSCLRRRRKPVPRPGSARSCLCTRPCWRGPYTAQLQCQCLHARLWRGWCWSGCDRECLLAEPAQQEPFVFTTATDLHKHAHRYTRAHIDTRHAKIHQHRSSRHLPLPVVNTTRPPRRRGNDYSTSSSNVARCNTASYAMNTAPCVKNARISWRTTPRSHTVVSQANTTQAVTLRRTAGWTPL